MKTFDIYTMPHSEKDELTKLTVTALDAGDNVVKEQIIENIPVTRNQITRCNSSFFGNGSDSKSAAITFHMTANPDWDGVNDFDF